MAEYGEWNRKGATLSDKTAKKEYGVTQGFIVQGIRTEHLEYRQGAVYGSSYLRILRSQLEVYISQEFGMDYLLKIKRKSELQKVKREITKLKKQLKELELLKAELS